MKRTGILAVVLAVAFIMVLRASAQDPIPAAPPEGAPLRSPVELDQILGPIALYPDPLIAQILPAATLPSQIVVADRYVHGGGDPNLIDQQPWDQSLKALARYPDVLKYLDDNIAWTTELGQAFLAQPGDVMNSIQHLRAQATDLGNLQSTPEENVITDSGTIEILPSDPNFLCVPIYQPELVFFQRPYGRRFISFGPRLGVGVWLNHDFDWRNHNLIVWGRTNPRPVDWWSHRPSERPVQVIRNATVWRPSAQRNLAAAGRIDRGWGDRASVRPAAPVVRGAPVRPAPASRVAVTTIGRSPAVAARPQASGALIGSQSAHDARQFSARGQESRQAAPRPAPAPRAAAPAPAPHSAPSGGGRKR